VSTVAVVIPSWNTAEHIDDCLDALYAQNGVELEVLVVDNGSVDDSLEILRRRGVAHLELGRNEGFARAVNLGVARTRAPFVLVLNADCFPAPGCVRLLLDTLAGNATLGGVQPRILQAGGGGELPRIYSAGQQLARNGSASERGWGEPDGMAFAQRAEVFGVSGAACMLRRELFTRLGGYDESYFAFYEDVDLNARARLAGWRFEYVAAASAVHVGHAGWSQQRRAHSFNVRLTVRNRLATAVKVLPASGVAGAALLTLRSLLASPFRGSARAAFAGAGSALRALPLLLRERRRVRAADPSRLDTWLARGAGAGPDPRRGRGS
jgi:GT2 family glycosyltransferase